MEFIRGLHNLRARHKGCVLTIGAFDGFHRGHQQLLTALRGRADDYRLPAVLVTLEPLPREFFAPDNAPPRLMSLREKIETAAELGLERMLCIRFTAEVSRIAAEDFIRQVFVSQLGVRHILVGDDVRFGHEQRGDIELLRIIGRDCGFGVETIDTVLIEGERVSSSRIRNALQNSDFASAKMLLGRPYAITGRITRGQRLGTELGFPTANIALYRHRVPMAGVYAVEVSGLDEKKIAGVANVGTRPTLGNLRKPLLEVHLFNFNRDIYGRRLKVLFRCKLRDERQFDSLQALHRQIAIDVDTAQKWFRGAA